MIQNLRKKFIAINMALVGLVLLAVFSVQCLSAFRRAQAQVYQAQNLALDWLTHASFPTFHFGGHRPDADTNDRNFPSIPSFAVEIDPQGQIISLKGGPGTTITAQTAQEMVADVLSRSGDSGSLPGQDLDYLCKSEGERHFITFADNSSVHAALRNQLITSLLIGSMALLAFYFISRFLANLALRSTELSWEQQRQFVADASHELKTPVTVILANTDIILAHPESPVKEQEKWITYIRNEADHMKALVDDLLFLAKSDAARSPLPFSSLSLSDLVTGSILSFESVAFESQITLLDEIVPEITVLGNEAQLRRLTVILLDNAIKYAGSQGTVTVKLDIFQERPRLTVHNTGTHIPAEHLPHLFERFYRADAARDRTQSGYGLGLAIAKTIADAHHSKISVSSAPDQGTTFTVIFPKK